MIVTPGRIRNEPYITFDPSPLGVRWTAAVLCQFVTLRIHIHILISVWTASQSFSAFLQPWFGSSCRLNHTMWVSGASSLATANFYSHCRELMHL